MGSGNKTEKTATVGINGLHPCRKPPCSPDRARNPDAKFEEWKLLCALALPQAVVPAEQASGLLDMAAQMDAHAILEGYRDEPKPETDGPRNIGAWLSGLVATPRPFLDTPECAHGRCDRPTRVQP